MSSGISVLRSLSKFTPADWAQTLPVEDIPEALGEIERLKAVLWGRMMAAKPQTQESPGRLLRVGEAAHELNCSKAWLYANADRLPFTRRLGGRQLRFDGQGIRDYIRAKNGSNRPK